MTSKDGKKIRDPVCLMMVDEGGFEIEYQQHNYAFCSQQCRDRFESNPHLYIGTPCHPSPKQHGDKVIKKRTLKLDEPLDKHQSDTIITDVKSMMGIFDIHIDENHICISYDLLQVTAEQIEEKIEATGKKLGNGLAEKLKRAFVHYLEESELDNLEQPGQGHQH